MDKQSLPFCRFNFHGHVRSCPLHIVESCLFCGSNFNFVDSSLSVKTVKIGPLKNFPLFLDFVILCTAANTIADEKPSIHSAPKGDLEVNIGEQLRWCVSGGSLGVHDLQWAWSQNPSLETVNITANVSGPPCLNCECAESAYYDLNIVQRYLHNTSVGGARGVAFSVLGYLDKNLQCSGVPTNFLSFMIIDGVRADDNLTELMFNVVSFTGDSTPEYYAIRACKW